MRLSDPPPDDERGVGLLLALLVMAATLVLGMGLVTSGLSELDVSGNFRDRATAYYAADSGIEKTLVDFRADSTWVDTIVDNTTWTLRDPLPTTVTIDGKTITLTTDADGNVVEDYYAFGGSESVSTGSFTRELRFPPTITGSGNSATLTFTTRSTGSGGIGDPSTQVIRADVELNLKRHGVWDNAIFANSGQAGNAINGNVAVRGSVHIIGDPDNPPSVEFSGTADLRNNYADAVDHFGADASKLPPLPTTEVNGQQVTTLDAEVRLKHGSITSSGNAEIGLPNDDSNTHKETVDAIRADGTVGPEDTVHTDEWGGYDADGVEFPTLDDPYTDASGTTCNTHREYLNNSSLTVNLSEISKDVDAFSYSDGSGNSISWDPHTGVMDVSGIVRVDGSLRLGKSHGQPGDRGVQYAGTGSLYTTGDTHIDGYLVPEDDYLTDGNLGIISDADVHIDESSQTNVFAAIYGEEEIVVSKQTDIAGALVSDSFDMGQNVPAVFQTPGLSTNLPPGMPGSGQMSVITAGNIVDWYQERGQ